MSQVRLVKLVCHSLLHQGGHGFKTLEWKICNFSCNSFFFKLIKYNYILIILEFIMTNSKLDYSDYVSSSY